MKICFFMLSSLLVNSVFAIANGEVTTFDEHPSFTNSFTAPPRGGGLCGGVLIHPQWVLTAAHCLQPVGETIYAGKTVESNKFIPRKVIKGVNHHQYTTGLKKGYDIRLLKLDSPYDTTNTPVRISRILKDDSELVIPGDSVYTIGLGIDKTGTFPGKLKIFNSTWIESPFVGDKQLLFINSEKGSVCGGDSGSPAFGKTKSGEQVVLAITSYGSGGCPSYYSGMSRASTHYDWIASVMGDDWNGGIDEPTTNNFWVAKQHNEKIFRKEGNSLLFPKKITQIEIFNLSGQTIYSNHKTGNSILNLNEIPVKNAAVLMRIQFEGENKKRQFKEFIN